MPDMLRLCIGLMALIPSTLAGSPYSFTITATSSPSRKTTLETTLPQVPTTGSGSAYAHACQDAISAYNDASSSWDMTEGWLQFQTATLGGPSTNLVTYYENATTLCDGHARVAYSPAISLSTGLVTISNGPATATSTSNYTVYWNFPAERPSCYISPSDCDPLWQTYSSSLSAWQAMNASATAAGSAPLITPPPQPQTPPCANQTAASSYASEDSAIRGCNVCTIFGDDVQLVYFPVPTTVSRDMCATTAGSSLTHYDPNGNDVIEAYAGTAYRGNGSANGATTAVVDGHTFTSGTAYISIGSVWAEDRCSHTVGTPVTNAILAMASESVLSLRYRGQHYQLLVTTDTQTGYPVSYADFNEPVPYSAWNAQGGCDYGGWGCQIIYEGQYRPQLAIPPGIKKLNPDWANCQMWYNGLYDPPLALQPGENVAKPTVPHPYGYSSTSSSPESTSPTPGWSPGPTTPHATHGPTSTPSIKPTAIPDQMSSHSSVGRPESQTDSNPSSTRKTDSSEHTSESQSTGDLSQTDQQLSSNSGSAKPQSYSHEGTITIVLPETDAGSTMTTSAESSAMPTPTDLTSESAAPSATHSTKKPSSGTRSEASNSLFYVLISMGMALGLV